jgi:2'-5' RNA ligase
MITNHGHKLFFALWPGDPERNALARLQDDVGGRLTPRGKLHLTLAFLGQQPAERLPQLLDILHALQVPHMRLEIDCYGYFARPRIAWAGMTQAPPALGALHAELMARLAQAGIASAQHDAFRPHITLAREANSAPPQARFDAVIWEASEVALVESMPDGAYRPIALQR